MKKTADQKKTVILVGNPNVGKSVIFSELTGRFAVVSNYPGTTVEVSRGMFKHNPKKIEIIDSPGVNSLMPKSEDELATLKILLENPNAAVVQVINSVSLKRGLYITAQLALTDFPVVLDLNIADEAASRGIEINRKKIEGLTGFKSVETVATRHQGMTKLRGLIKKPGRGFWRPKFDNPVENALNKIESIIPSSIPHKRFLALLCLTEECYIDDLKTACTKSSSNTETLIEKISDIRRRLSGIYNGNLSFQVNRQLHREAQRLYDEVIKTHPHVESRFANALAEAMMNRFWGLVIAVFVLIITYLVVGRFGAGDIVNFVEGTIFDKWITPQVSFIIKKITPDGFIEDLLIGPYGLWTIGITYAIAIVLPIVFLFFLIFGILEDSGYLPRLAVMLNRPFRFMGLSGKAVLPMVLGLGCATMATLTARILETKKERVLVTFLLALAIPCSAQLGVIMGMLGVLPGGALLWWLGSIIFVLLLVGKLASLVLPGEDTLFIQEIPPLRIPRIKNLVIKTLARMEWYLKEAVPLFAAGAFLLFILNRTGAMHSIEESAGPVISGLMGLPKETASAFILGFIRRDYAATGLFDMSRSGILTPVQGLVGMVAITLFIPCIANLFVIIKERGWKTATWMTLFIIPFAILYASLLHVVLKILGITFQ